MLTYEMFNILMTEYEDRHSYWTNASVQFAEYAEECMSQVFDADLALTQLKAAYPEYYATRVYLVAHYDMENVIDAPF